MFLYVGLVNFRLCLEHVFGLERKYEENNNNNNNVLSTVRFPLHFFFTLSFP